MSYKIGEKHDFWVHTVEDLFLYSIPTTALEYEEGLISSVKGERGHIIEGVEDIFC